MKQVSGLFVWVCCFLSFSSWGFATPDEHLLTAAQRGDVVQVESSLRAGADVNATDENGIASLLWASFYGHAQVVKVLLAHHADVNLACKNMNLMLGDGIRFKDTALGIAVKKGDVDIVELLLPQADLNAKNSMNRTALMIAASSGNIEIAKLLIAAGANVNQKGGTEDTTALIEAVKSGNSTMTAFLLNAGTEPNATDKNRETALTIAKREGFTKIADLLRQSGATEAKTLDRSKTSTLLDAVKSGDIELAKQLLATNINYNEKWGEDQNTALMEAVLTGNENMVALLVNAGVEIEAVNGRQETALTIAERAGFLKIADLLRQSGATVTSHLYIKIPFVVGLFFIVFGLAGAAVPKIFPDMSGHVGVKVVSLMLSCALAAVCAGMAWHSPQMIELLSSKIFSGFSGGVTSFLSVLFSVVGIYLFGKNTRALFNK